MGNGLFINGKKDGQVTFVKAENISDDSRTKENGKTWEFLLVAGPSPPVWEPNVCEKFMVYFAFYDLRNIFGLHKQIYYNWRVFWLVKNHLVNFQKKVGFGRPPPPVLTKFPHFPALCSVSIP